jgi:hypothetical protein
MTGKADIRKWDKKKRRIDSRNTVNSYQESRATKFTPQGSGNSELIRPQSEGDLNMNTFDIINMDRMIFATDAGAGDTLAITEYGIEAIANGSSAAYGLTYQIPTGKIHTFNVGSVGALVVTGSSVVATVDMTTANINLGSFKIKYSEISTPSPNPAANEGFMYAKDVSGVTTPMWLDSAGTETSLLGGGSSGWVGTATSTLDMDNFDIEDVNALKINSGVAGSADSFTMFGTSSAGAINLVDDTDTFNIQVDGTSRLTISDSLVTSSVPISATGIQDVGHVYLDGAGTNDLLIDGTIDGLEYKVPTGDEHQFFVNSVERMAIKSTHTNIENYIDIRSPTTTPPTNTAYTGIIGWFKIKVAGGDYRMPVWAAP